MAFNLITLKRKKTPIAYTMMMWTQILTNLNDKACARVSRLYGHGYVCMTLYMTERMRMDVLRTLNVRQPSDDTDNDWHGLIPHDHKRKLKQKHELTFTVCVH